MNTNERKQIHGCASSSRIHPFGKINGLQNGKQQDNPIQQDWVKNPV